MPLNFEIIIKTFNSFKLNYQETLPFKNIPVGLCIMPLYVDFKPFFQPLL